MIDGFTFLCDIFIHDGESRAVHLVGDTHFVAKVLDERGLTCAHCAVERDNVGFITQGNQIFGNLSQSLHAVDMEFFGIHCYVFSRKNTLFLFHAEYAEIAELIGHKFFVASRFI